MLLGFGVCPRRRHNVRQRQNKKVLIVHCDGNENDEGCHVRNGDVLTGWGGRVWRAPIVNEAHIMFFFLGGSWTGGGGGPPPGCAPLVPIAVAPGPAAASARSRGTHSAHVRGTGEWAVALAEKIAAMWILNSLFSASFCSLFRFLCFVPLK